MVGYICPRCRQKVPSGKICPCRMMAYPKTGEIYAFYHSREWRRLVRAVRARDAVHGISIDRYAYTVHGIFTPGRIVHHILPIEEAWDRRFDPSNLILVSDSSHGEIHAALKAGGARREEVIAACRRAISRQGGAV